MPIHLSGVLTCATAEDAALVRHHLPAHIAATQAEPGCLMFEITPSEEVPRQWRVAESFIDSDAFEAHQRRTKHSPWGQATGHIPRDYHVVET